jgi:hypothetical protein
MSEKLFNTIQLVNAKVCFNIHMNCTPHAKSHYDVEVELHPEFKTQKEYLEFRKSWKNLYMTLSDGIRRIRPLIQLACQPSMATDNFFRGRYKWPHHELTNNLFFWRMRAKALLKALAMAKRLAGEQREQQCPRCLRRDCECLESDVVDAEAKG